MISHIYFILQKIKMYTDELIIYACINNELDRVKFEMSQICSITGVLWVLTINIQKC